MGALQYTPFVLPLAVSAALIVAVLYVTWRNRAEDSAPWFAASLVALLIWTVGYAFELMATSLNVKVALADVQYVGIAALPLLWLQVVLIYTRRRGLSPAVLAVLVTLCVAVVAMVFVNPGDLFRGDPAVVTQGSLTALQPDYGPLWRYVGLPWVYLLSLAVVLVLVRGMLHTQRTYVRQYTALLVATVIPLAGASVYAVGLSPWRYYNPAMALISASGLLMAYALFHYRLFDVAPLARDAVIDGLADGLVVVDLENRLRDFNPAARQVFPALRDDAVGRPVEDVLAIAPAMLQSLRREAQLAGASDGEPCGLARADISVAAPEDEGGQRDFSLLFSPVRSRGGRVVGHALTLHDVTDSAELLARLEQLACRDQLTGLLSAEAWTEQAEHELLRACRYGHQLGLAVVDVDGLRLVNEAFGLAAGDTVLRALAGACRNSVRPFDLVGRVGDDEVGVLLPHLTAGETLQAGCQLRDAVKRLRVPSGDDLMVVSASVGLASTEHAAGVLLPGLRDQAEAALRDARAGGRGQVACAWGD